MIVESKRTNPIAIGTLIKGAEDPASRVRLLSTYGFESFSIMFWQNTGEIDLAMMAEQVQEAIEETSRHISSLSIYGNVLDDSENGRRTLSDLKELMEIAPRLHVPVISCFAGRVPNSSIPESLPRFHQVFSPIVERAEELGIKIAFENCRLGDTWKKGRWNIAINADAWNLMFESIPSPTLGLEWEPCHQVEALIDPMQQLKKWLPRIYHIHGKDSRIDWSLLKEHGLYGNANWHASCFPGFGDTDWSSIFHILNEGGYKGSIDIEGWNDANFSGDREIEGQLKALSYLKGARYDG